MTKKTKKNTAKTKPTKKLTAKKTLPQEGREDEDARLYFSDGHMLTENSFFVTGHFSKHKEWEATRNILWLQDRWAARDNLEEMYYSIASNEALGLCLAISPNGSVQSFGTLGKSFSEESIRGSFQVSQLPVKEAWGVVNSIQSIGEDFFVCGQSAQVYRWNQGDWQSIGLESIENYREITFESIDGVHESAVYAVGLNGVVAYYDGFTWEILSVPSRKHLSKVCCVSEEEVYLCGNDGTLLKGSKSTGWVDCSSPRQQQHFWGMAHHQGKLYLATSSSLWSYDGSALTEEILVIASPPQSFGRLHSRGGSLISLGINRIFVLNSDGWKEFLWPDNPGANT